jgi:ribonuclease HIII
VHVGARVVLEQQFNRMLESTRNKGSTLFSISAIHIDLLLNRFADRGLVIFCDRQGGREQYGALLRQMFDQWSLEIVSEIEGRAEYWLTRGGGTGPRVRLIFCEKAEGLCLSVAVASMLSKYLRELLMHRFNAYWRQHLPDLAPTAGYYTDGERFLRDIAAKRSELGIADEQLVRCR